MNSLWTDTTKLPHFPALEGDAKTDVLVIGGGISGILCAFMLQQAGVDYLLAEADCLCSGITCDTTAKITSQHGLIYAKLLREFGLEKAALYLQSNQNALLQYEQLCKDIDCDYVPTNSFVYSLTDPTCLEEELEAIHLLGYKAEYVPELSLPMPTKGAVCFPAQAQFHPLKFLREIVKSLNIYEHTKITELKNHTAQTPSGQITAEQIVIATHFPILNKHGMYFLKMYQSRSYVLALEHASHINGMYVDAADNGLSFRMAGDLLLLGGSGHRTGKKSGGWTALSEYAKQYYPQAKERQRWATQDCMTLDRLPYVGLYGSQTEGLYVMTGFNKWGMSSSMTAAMLIRDLLLGKDNPCASLFAPDRTILRPQLALNALEAVWNLLSPSTRRCPHMGCALKWNTEEHTWDCPCHGSRFEGDGKLIDNPATDDLNRTLKLP